MNGISNPSGKLSDPQPLSDWSLLQSIKQKDEQAMAGLFARHSRLVYSVALRVLKDPHLAEDVLQEVFMQMWRKPVELLSDGGNFPAYLAVATRNRCIDMLRQQKPMDDVDGLQIASKYNLANDAEQHILLDRVRAAVGELPREQRSSMEMAFFDGLTHTEIAQQTGLPLGTVKTRIRTALQRLERAFHV